MSTWTWVALLAVLALGFGIFALSVFQKKWASDADVAIYQADAAVHQSDQAAYAAYTSHKDTVSSVLGGVGKILGGIF